MNQQCWTPCLVQRGGFIHTKALCLRNHNGPAGELEEANLQIGASEGLDVTNHAVSFSHLLPGALQLGAAVSSVLLRLAEIRHSVGNRGDLPLFLCG